MNTEKPMPLLGTRCRVCIHPQRTEIELALSRGESKLSVSRRYGVHRAALKRHVDRHLAPEIARLAQDREKAHLERLLKEIEDDRAVLNEAIDSLRDPKTGLIKPKYATAIPRLIRERRGGTELIGKATGVLAQQGDSEDSSGGGSIVIVVPPPAPLGQPVPQESLAPPTINVEPVSDKE